MRDVLDERPAYTLEHLHHRGLVVAAEDRAASVPDHAVFYDRPELAGGRHRVEVGAEEERRPLGNRLESCIDVAEAVLVGLEAEVAQKPEDDICGGALLAGRRRQRGEFEKEVDRLGHVPILRRNG